MRRILFILLALYSFQKVSYSQCTVTPSTGTNIIECEDSVAINITGYALSAISENFLPTGPTDPGWQSSAGAIYTNPFIPSPTNDTYFWMGTSPIVPTALTTIPFNVSFGGLICFDFVYAIQGGAAPIEGPDLSEEGITLQYTTNGGATWNSIVYFMPNGQQLPSNPGPGFPMTTPPFNAGGTPYTVWNSVCFPIPAGAIGPNTSFQWIQENNSGACCDHWGLDNISIQLADPSYTFYLQNNLSVIDTNFVYVSPTQDSTFTIMYTNGTNDTCFGSVDVQVEPTVAVADFFICEGTGDTLSLTGVAPWANVTWTGPGIVNPTSQTPLVNPTGPNQSHTYTVTSACGSDDVTVTFYSVDAVAEKDTICPNEFNQVFANVTGITTDCQESYTVFEIPYYKETGTPTPLVFSQADNGTSQILTLPFPFNYYCTPVTEVRVSTNGYLLMSSANFSLANNLTIPANLLPNNMVALMWDDLIDSQNSSNYFVTGSAPNRKFVVDFRLNHVGGTF
jgi:hypothetical protein